MSAPFVLVCDDSKPIAHSLVFMLQGSGFRAQAVHAALDCVTVARRDRPDLILMDIMMPGMDGAMATALISDNPELRGIPILLVSAMPEAEVRARAESAGAAGYLLKPYRREDLVEAVRRWTGAPPPMKHTA